MFADDPTYVTEAGQNTFTVRTTSRDNSFSVQCESKNEAGTLYTTSVLNVYGMFLYATSAINVYGMLLCTTSALNVYGMYVIICSLCSQCLRCFAICN